MSDFIFDGFEPANTTPVPDVLFDILLSKLTGAEIKILLYIIRRTWGFKKATDAISLSQLQNGITTREGKQLDCGCGIKRRDTICEALASLEKKRCITAVKQKTTYNDYATTVYGICFKQQVVTKPDYPQTTGSHQTGLPLVSKPDYRSHQTGLGVVTKPDPQETVIQLNSLQETVIQQEITSNASGTETFVASATPPPVDFQNLMETIGSDEPRTQIIDIEHKFITLDDPIQPTQMIVSLTPKAGIYYAPMEDERRSEIAHRIAKELQAKHGKLAIRYVHEPEQQTVIVESTTEQQMAAFYAIDTPAIDPIPTELRNTEQHNTQPEVSPTSTQLPTDGLHSEKPMSASVKSQDAKNELQRDLDTLTQTVDELREQAKETSDKQASRIANETTEKPAKTRGKKELTSKPEKTPLTEEEQAKEVQYDTRRKFWQGKINERRGGPLRAKGLCINETECLKVLVREFDDIDIGKIDRYLSTEHWKYKKNPAEIGGKALLDESRPILQLLKGKVNQMRSISPQQVPTPIKASMTQGEACKLAHDAIIEAKQYNITVTAQAAPTKNPDVWIVRVRWDDGNGAMDYIIKAYEQWQDKLKEIRKIIVEEAKQDARRMKEAR